MKKVCLLVVLAILGCASASLCKFPPSLWCSSREVATQCQVIPQCEQHFKKAANAEPVSIGLYVESLCPDCKLFIKKQLGPTWEKVQGIMNLTIVPYGNAMEKWDGKQWNFTCQHGPDECMGNLIETCAIASVNYDVTKYFPFINCIESSERLPSKVAPQCASKFHMDYDSIMKCVNSTQGNALQHQMAQVTDALKPPHEYVPWITLNGMHTEEIQTEAEDDLLKLVCNTYKGTPPPACTAAEKKPHKCTRT